MRKLLSGPGPLEKIRATNTGQIIKLHVAKVFDNPDILMTLFLFTENSVEFWLPIQSQLIEPLKEELKKGEAVTQDAPRSRDQIETAFRHFFSAGFLLPQRSLRA
jgi:hypothetical protein